MKKNNYRLWQKHAQLQSSFYWNDYHETSDMKAGFVCNAKGEKINNFIPMKGEPAFFIENGALYSGTILFCMKEKGKYGPYAYVRYYNPENGKMKWKYCGKVF